MFNSSIVPQVKAAWVSSFFNISEVRTGRTLFDSFGRK